MRTYIFKIVLTIPVTLLSVDDIQQEINEGHLYNEERISAKKLFDVLGEDAGKATDCFGSGDSAKNENRKLKSGKRSQPQNKRTRD